jgi:hypothetical protein
MGSSDWPTLWVFLAPVMMLAFMGVCMASMRCMPGMHRRHDPNHAEGARGTDSARAGPHVPARFPAGLSAFEEYRAETLQRLDREQTECHDFLDHLRTAKDKAEFDRFMAERRRRPTPPA